jgi:hypothetical protein
MLAVPARQTSVSPHLVRFSRAARCDRQARSAPKETDSAHTQGVPSCGPARTVVPSTSPSTLDACLRNRHNDRAPLDLHAGRGISASLPVGRKLNPDVGMSKMLFDREARPHRLGEALQTLLFGWGSWASQRRFGWWKPPLYPCAAIKRPRSRPTTGCRRVAIGENG